MGSASDIGKLAEEWGRVQAQEISLIAAGLKPSARVRVRRERLPELARLARQLSVQMIVGYEAVKGQSVSGRGSFSEWCKRKVCTPHTAGHCYAYLAKNHLDGQRLRRLDEARADEAVGELLGYPTCCIEAFCRRIEVKGAPADPVLRRYATTRPIDWRMNVSLLCFDFTLLTHVPCDPYCGDSLKLAAGYFDFFSEESPAFAAELGRVMRSWVIHTEVLGVAAFTAKRLRGCLEVSDVLAVYPDSFLGSILRRSAVVEHEENCVTIDGVVLSGKRARLLQYCEV